MLQRAWLFARTLPHLKLWQIAGRVVAGLKRKVGFARVPSSPPALQGVLRQVATWSQHDPWNTHGELIQGRFTFLNQTEVLGWPPDWKAAHRPLLWRFNLHYFQYLHLLRPTEQEVLCRDWVAAHPVGTGVGWLPYPVSLRLVNWCRAGMQAPDVLASLYQQAAYLYRNMETYVYGNHLLENARALVVAGCFFEGQGEAPRWLDRGLEVYRQETPEQVLADGLHYERSPMYHALMLEGYLDLLNVLPADHPDRAWLGPVAQRMTDALASVVHPDEQFALFNDATQEIALPAQTLVDYAHALTGHTPQPHTSFPEAGYYIHRDDTIFLMIDGGPVGPDYLMAHAHADVFSYELSVEGQPFVVDSGVFEYEAGPMRQYVRSTAAHNTVGVDGVDQVECWGSFRVARRCAPHDVTFERTPSTSRFEGSFSGYARLIGDDIQHRRRLTVDGTNRRITVEDVVEGRGVHDVRSRIHLHPAVTVSEANNTFVLERDGVTAQFEADAAAIHWEDGWYCPRFGVRQRNKVLVLGGQQPLPAQVSYRIRY